jgi:hypothetical protein
MTETPRGTNQIESELLARGRSDGLATAALALGALSFIQLLGAEKAILAIVLALLALRGPLQQGRGRAVAGIVLGTVYLGVTAVTLVLFRDQLAELIHLLQSLG